MKFSVLYREKISSLNHVCSIECMKSENKKGGPYTIQEQESRRKQVYELHFEKGFSAIKIAERLEVNRNTINADIKEWYRKVSEELPTYNVSLLLKQIHRLEMQQSRLLEELENCAETKGRFAIEKILYAINSKIASETSKLVFSRRDMLGRLRS